MKKLLVAIALSLLTVSTYAIDRNDDIKKISYVALRQFEADFQLAKDVSWKTNDQYVKATFTSEGKNMAALYDLQGGYLGVVQYLDYEQVPLKVRNEIGKRYSDYTFSSALKIVGRPSDRSDFNDIGTYWIDLTNDTKQVYLSVSPSLSVSLFKTIEIETTASK